MGMAIPFPTIVEKPEKKPGGPPNLIAALGCVTTKMSKMSRELDRDASSCAFFIESFLREASHRHPSVLHLNSDGLVIEYNDIETGQKRFETISVMRKNNS